jgi:hypothetical protein
MIPQFTIQVSIAQGQSQVPIALAQMLSFVPAGIWIGTMSGAGGTVIKGDAVGGTLSQSGVVINLSGAPIDNNQVLVVTFYGKQQAQVAQPVVNTNGLTTLIVPGFEVEFILVQGVDSYEVELPTNLNFIPVCARAWTTNTVSGSVIEATSDATTLTPAGVLVNFSGMTIDGNQVLHVIFFKQIAFQPVYTPPVSIAPTVPTIIHKQKRGSFTDRLHAYGYENELRISGEAILVQNNPTMALVNTSPNYLEMLESGYLDKEPVAFEIYKGNPDDTRVFYVDGLQVPSNLRGFRPQKNRQIVYDGKARKMMTIHDASDRWIITTILDNVKVPVLT